MTPRADVSRLPELLRRGLRTEGTAYLLTADGLPVAWVVGAVRARLACCGRDVTVSDFTAATAADAWRDLLHLVRRAGDVIVAKDAPAGRTPAAVLPLHAHDWIWPGRGENSTTEESTTDDSPERN